jgi:hypothetical protein
MTDAEIKIKLFRLIDSQQGYLLQDIYNLLKVKFGSVKKDEVNLLSDIEVQYKQMADDQNREKDALEWAEGTLNSEE